MSSTPPPVCVSVGYVSRVYASGWSSFMSVGESRGCGRAGDLASSCRVVGSVEVCRVSCESERRCRACPSAVKCNILSERISLAHAPVRPTSSGSPQIAVPHAVPLTPPCRPPWAPPPLSHSLLQVWAPATRRRCHSRPSKCRPRLCRRRRRTTTSHLLFPCTGRQQVPCPTTC